jgi:outer membrane receptor for ferrienterochelin and colicins
MTSVAINARGFNSSFNNRMLMVEDGRIMVLPENGLPVGQFTATPKVDIAGMEVLVGPGAALYGADASSGVLSVQTRDPRDYPGLTVEATGGFSPDGPGENRSPYRDLQARWAGVFGDWGVKVSGEYQEAEDWSNRLTFVNGGAREYRPGDESIAGAQPEVGPGGATGLDWNTRVMRGSAAVVRYLGDSRLSLSAGASETDGVGQTNVGRNQLLGWQYNFQQARFSSPRWYLNVYRAQSRSGDSYAVNRFTNNWYPNQLLPANQRRTDEQLIAASDWPSDGRMLAAEAQYNTRLPFLFNTSIVLGGQVRRDQVSSDRQWLSDRLTLEDIVIDQMGVYGQATVPVYSWLDLVGAARLDDHENYEAQFSPKAGVVVRPMPGHNLRVTYNRAFKSPTILQTNFWIPDWTATVAIFGNNRGFTARRPDGTLIREYRPLQPEENTTWEFGYKGVLGERLFLDVAHFRSSYRHFMSPLAIISDPFGLGLAGEAPGLVTHAFDADGQRLNSASDSAAIALTYWNLGRAQVNGFDAGVDFVLTPRVSLRGTVSTIDLTSSEVEVGREESTTLNSPELKLSLGATFQGFGPLSGGFTVRHVDEYYFRSGVNRGFIPTFTTVDASLSYRLDRFNTMLNVGVSNLFACGGRFEYAPADVLYRTPTGEDRGCGFNRRHFEMINMPEIGTMVFVGLRYQMR